MTDTKPPSPSAQFIRSIKGAIAYWRKRTQEMDDNTIRRLDAERQNIFQAVQFGLVPPQTWRDAAMVVLQTFDLIEQRGYWQEWIPVMEMAITHCADDQLHLKVKLLNQLGQFYRFLWQLVPALAAHKEAETIAQQLRDEQMLAESHCSLSELYLRQRQYDKAEQYGQSALTQFTNVDVEEKWLAATLNTLGELARFRGDLLLAEKRLSQAAAHWRSLNKPVRIARTLNDLAVTFLAAGKFEQAHQCYIEVVTLLEPTTNELDKVMVQINLGVLYFRQEKWIEAEAVFRKADSACIQQSPNIYYQALIANNLGNVLLKQNRLEEAALYLHNAAAFWRQTGDNLELANTLGTLAETTIAQKRVLDAIPLYEEAIEILSDIPDDARAENLQKSFVAQQEAIQFTSKQ